MDNDKKVIAVAKKRIRQLKYLLQYRDRKILSDLTGNEYISNLFKTNESFAIGRLGATEARCAYPTLNRKTPKEKYLLRGQNLSGIFPPDIDNNNKFAQEYLNSLRNMDAMILWGVYKEKEIVDIFCPNAVWLKDTSVQPYYFIDPWSQVLTNMKVLIIHPFATSILNQYKIRDKLFANPKILPEFKELKIIKAVQSIGGNSDFSSWNEALNYMKNEMEEVDFDVAIIGAGAYALPLVSHAKKIGKIGIQMAGALQIWFGIKGMRWDKNLTISKLYNEHWIRANIDETPSSYKNVEGGSYW